MPSTGITRRRAALRDGNPAAAVHHGLARMKVPANLYVSAHVAGWQGKIGVGSAPMPDLSGPRSPVFPAASGPAATPPAASTVLTILLAASFSHGLNDTIQAVIPAVYPLLKTRFLLDFGQVGLITLTFQLTASLLQPFVGLYTDRRPLPFSLAAGMGVTLIGLALLSRAGSFPVVLLAAALVGMGSAVFHPEASRVARMASGGRHGLAQSVFQVGGNTGSALGPLLAAMIVVPRGQAHIAWFCLAALLGIVVLTGVGRWYRQTLRRRPIPVRTAGGRSPGPGVTPEAAQSAGRVMFAIGVLVVLIFSKYFYLASMTNYYTFYLIDRFGLSVQAAQVRLFVFLAAVAAGTLIGGPIGDRIGRKRVIWVSILGVAPFTLLLPHVGLSATVALSVVIGFILASAFSAILVYAQELVPGKVGLISGLFFGFAFGMGGIGSAVLGRLADRTSIGHVFAVCAYLPLLGLLTALLPETSKPGLDVPRMRSSDC